MIIQAYNLSEFCSRLFKSSQMIAGLKPEKVSSVMIIRLELKKKKYQNIYTLEDFLNPFYFGYRLFSHFTPFNI